MKTKDSGWESVGSAEGCEEVGEEEEEAEENVEEIQAGLLSDEDKGKIEDSEACMTLADRCLRSFFLKLEVLEGPSMPMRRVLYQPAISRLVAR